MAERAARTEHDLGMHLDQTLRELSAQGGELIGQDDYIQAYEAADPKYIRCGMFVSHDGKLCWHVKNQHFRKQLTASELASLPEFFLYKRPIPIDVHAYPADTFRDIPRLTHALLRRAFSLEMESTPANEQVYFPLRWMDEIEEKIAANAMHHPTDSAEPPVST